MPTLDLFVYGTLRPGQRLHDWLAPCLLESKPGTLYGGRLYRSRSHDYFPYLVPAGVLNPVKGDICKVETGSKLAMLTAMEVDAGYELDWLPVKDETGNTTVCAVFVWDRPEDLPGRLTPLGYDDWAQYEKVRLARSR